MLMVEVVFEALTVFVELFAGDLAVVLGTVWFVCVPPTRNQTSACAASQALRILFAAASQYWSLP